MSITSGTGEFATRAIHAGYDPADYGHAAVPPIYASAAFDLENAQRGDALAGGLIDGFEYSRVANPTVDVLEKRLAALEGGIGAVAVGSGMAAESSLPATCTEQAWMHSVIFFHNSASIPIS